MGSVTWGSKGRVTMAWKCEACEMQLKEVAGVVVGVGGADDAHGW